VVLVGVLAVLGVILVPRLTNGSTSSEKQTVSGSGSKGTLAGPPAGARSGGGTLGTAQVASSPARYPTPDGIAAAWVVAENRKGGTAFWKITGVQTPDGIMGYANLVQAVSGQTVNLYVSTRASTFHVESYRMGYYGGAGARLVWRSAEVPGVVQPTCPVTRTTNMVSCDWSPSLSFLIDSSWVPGQYLLKLVGSGGQQSYVPLIVWDPASLATYVVMSGVLTDDAFNSFGGFDLYQGATSCAPQVYPCSTRSKVVSFDRPYLEGNGAASYLQLVYPLTRFVEENGLDITYWTDIVLATRGNLLTNHKVLISAGHDEEWSLQMRQAAQAAAGRGVNLIFLGASPVLRKVRLQPSPLGPDREMVNYRDPQSDPFYGVDNADVSQNWWAQAPANLPERRLVGADYVGYNNDDTFPLVVSEPGSWLFSGTGLSLGATIPGVFSGDFQAYDRAARDNPPGVEILAHSHLRVTDHPDIGYADTTYYTMPSSQAGVFSSGTIGWTPALADCAPRTTGCPAQVMRTLTGNLLRVFGTGPVGLQYRSTSNWQRFYG
jgi:hypothetical protein